MDRHFPTQVVKLHSTDKPWISPKIKLLIKKRQKALVQKKMYLWRFLRNKIARLLSRAEKFYYKDRIQNLKTCDPAGWHKGIQMVTQQKASVPFKVTDWMFHHVKDNSLKINSLQIKYGYSFKKRLAKWR